MNSFLKLSLLVFIFVSFKALASEDVKFKYQQIYKAGKSIILIVEPKIILDQVEYKMGPVAYINDNWGLSGTGFCTKLFGQGSYSSYYTNFLTSDVETVAQILPNGEFSKVSMDSPVKAFFCYVPEDKMPNGLEDLLVIYQTLNQDGTVTIDGESHIKLPFTISEDQSVVRYESDVPSHFKVSISYKAFDGVDYGNYVSNGTQGGLMNRSLCKYLGYKEEVSMDLTVMYPADDSRPTFSIINGFFGYHFNKGTFPYKSLTCK